MLKRSPTKVCINAQQIDASFNYDDIPIPKLSGDYRQFDEGVITLDKCSKVLNSFALNKTPGNDGLPIEFYRTFWNLVGELFVESFNSMKEMSSSQRQAVITLIEKKDQDRCDLKNWRPISLRNIDAKIASKSYC